MSELQTQYRDGSWRVVEISWKERDAPEHGCRTFHECLSDFANGSDAIYRRRQFGQTMLYTDGVRFITETAGGGAHWLVDLIMSHQFSPKVRREVFQSWKLTVRAMPDGSTPAVVTCDDGNGNVVARQKIPYTDFPVGTVKLYLENGTLMLPAER